MLKAGMTHAIASEILELEPGFSQTELKTAFRRMASTYHPDHGGDPVRFAEIRQAYETLKLCGRCLGTGTVERREGALIRRDICDCGSKR